MSDGAMGDAVIVESARPGISKITLNRPERLNAMNYDLVHGLYEALDELSADRSCRVIVLTGAGRGFCAGADMDVLQTTVAAGEVPMEGPPAGPVPFDANSRDDFHRQYAYFPAVPKPILAAINGPCAGLGLVLALYADMRFASDAAVFTTAFARRGLIAEHGISWLLPRMVGMAHAADLLFSARTVRPPEALAMGLVNRVIPHQEFEAEVMAYARMLAHEVSPRSLGEMKREIWNGMFQNLGEAIDAANRDMRRSFTSEDFKEGVAHFVEKRAPAFTGR
jgi:enoyl-CoA hydratase/carnithine racemase